MYDGCQFRKVLFAVAVLLVFCMWGNLVCQVRGFKHYRRGQADPTPPCMVKGVTRPRSRMSAQVE